MNRNIIYWICQVGGWSSHALFNILFLISRNELTLNDFIVILLDTLCFIFFSHLYRIYIKKKGWIKLYFSTLIPKVLVAIFVLSVITYPFQFAIAYFFNLSVSREEFEVGAFFMSMTGFIILYFGWSLIYFLYHYVEEYNKSLKWEAYANEFELNKLKSQLNPHFIFNALNSIRALVDENPAKSKEAINALANILRSSLRMDKQKLIPFEQELKAVKDYLALETIRFEERLSSEINIDPATYSFKVPPLMIQTLVENGIKHGISKLKAGGVVKLETRIGVNDNLIISIRNNGVYLNGNSPEGFGLENTRQRLRLLFGERASFNITNERENMVLTELIIPKY